MKTIKEQIEASIEKDWIAHPTDMFLFLRNKIKNLQLQDVINTLEEKGYKLNEFNILIKA